MKTISVYLQQIKTTAKHITFTDGAETIRIPRNEIIDRRRIAKSDYEVTITQSWAKGEGIV